jgi:hypothetical protein
VPPTAPPRHKKKTLERKEIVEPLYSKPVTAIKSDSTAPNRDLSSLSVKEFEAIAKTIEDYERKDREAGIEGKCKYYLNGEEISLNHIKRIFNKEQNVVTAAAVAANRRKNSDDDEEIRAITKSAPPDTNNKASLPIYTAEKVTRPDSSKYIMVKPKETKTKEEKCSESEREDRIAEKILFKKPLNEKNIKCVKNPNVVLKEIRESTTNCVVVKPKPKSKQQPNYQVVRVNDSSCPKRSVSFQTPATKTYSYYDTHGKRHVVVCNRYSTHNRHHNHRHQYDDDDEDDDYFVGVNTNRRAGKHFTIVEWG